MPKPVQASVYTFRHLIEGGFVYVDKTAFIYEMVHRSAGVFFLSRPRRFGKSLLISTLDELFRGSRELFRGLWIDGSDYAWENHPVVRIDFSRESVHSAAELQDFLIATCQEIATRYGVEIQSTTYQRTFSHLIQALAKQGQVVILIDEYDKPILDNITDLAAAQAVRDVLKGFYTTIKSLDEYLRFVFITGISKFSRVGIFSGMNNLTDLTADRRFGALLGLTEEEIQRDLHEQIAAFAAQEKMDVAEAMAKMRHWYDGYRFVPEGPDVYNPFSTLQFLVQRRFANYWFETGTPTFLLKLLKDGAYDVTELEELRLRELAFSTYEIETLSILPLLFQTGYLTIKSYEPTRQVYTLGYPNFEVERAFIVYLLAEFNEQERSANDNNLWKLVDALESHNLERFFALLTVFFANVPYDIQIRQEKYYQTIFYLIFKMMGVAIDVEVHTNSGRMDALIRLPDHIYIFEFKLDGSAQAALEQIEANGYAQPYQNDPRPTTLIGVNFDSQRRQVAEWISRP
jgi:hypothetical protein